MAVRNQTAMVELVVHRKIPWVLAGHLPMPWHVVMSQFQPRCSLICPCFDELCQRGCKSVIFTVIVYVSSPKLVGLPKNWGAFGIGRLIESPLRTATTVVILGLLTGSSWMLNRPICMHFFTSSGSYFFSRLGSNKSSTFSSFQSLHACHCWYSNSKPLT